MWRNKEGNKNKGHEQDGKINQRMQRVILPTEEKLITDDSVPKRIFLNLPNKRSMFFFFFALNE